jgi:hypothetical protein
MFGSVWGLLLALRRVPACNLSPLAEAALFIPKSRDVQYTRLWPKYQTPKRVARMLDI